MAQMPVSYDPTQHEASTAGGNQLPVSDKNGHLVYISESDIKDTKAGTGKYIELTFKMVEGNQTGIMRLNIVNPNEQAVAISQQQLSAVCAVVGWTESLKETKVLHNIPFRAVVELQKDTIDKETGVVTKSLFTEIKGVKHSDGSNPGQGPVEPSIAIHGQTTPNPTNPAPTPPPAAVTPSTPTPF